MIRRPPDAVKNPAAAVPVHRVTPHARADGVDRIDGVTKQFVFVIRLPLSFSRPRGTTPMNITMILNDAPYGNERTFNALRLADTLLTLDEDVTFVSPAGSSSRVNSAHVDALSARGLSAPSL